MSFEIGDRVVVIKDIFTDSEDSVGCVGKLGTIVGFNCRNEVLLDNVPLPLGFDDFELELVK